MKQCLTSLGIGEIQIKITVKYYYRPVRMTKIKNMATLKAGGDVDKPDHSYIAGRTVNS